MGCLFEHLLWPDGGLDLGMGGISFDELLILKELPWRRLILVIFDHGVQFQCRLFCLVQALIFAALVDSLLPL